MPDWTPDWDDVAFDTAAAGAAAQACRAAAAAITDVRTGMATQLPVVTEQWRGRFRDDFDAEEPAAGRQLDLVRDDLLKLASRIDDAIDAAAYEQHRRETDRQRWINAFTAELGIPMAPS